jgi:hypothetical protein
MRFLNLDPIRQPGGEVQINGKTYQVWPIQLKTVVNLNAAQASPGADSQGITFAEQLQQTVAVLQQLMPDVPVEEYDTLTLEQLNTLLGWAREVAYGVTEKNEDAPAGETPAPAPEETPIAASTSPA